MSRPPSDQAARDRFRDEWSVNLAVVANAGSGKTTAISERLAAMALSPVGSEMLGRTTVVTYTRKAAAQIGQRARAVLLRRMAQAGRTDAEALAGLDRVFFGTIHSFCLALARRHGSEFGIHLNPTMVDDDEETFWEEFLEQDPMTFSALGPQQISAFLRHTSLDKIFDLAIEMDHATARRLLEARPQATPPGPDAGALERILSASPSRKGSGAEALGRNKERALTWLRRFEEEAGALPIAEPQGKAAGIVGLYRAFFAPLKAWLAATGGVLAAELSLRYRAWRLGRGIQTYADQVDTALGILDDPSMLERIRAEGWRVLLDEAQDTDSKQFDVLVEIARPPGAARGTWPRLGGAGPRPGHFCMVGDPQQGIYSTRADIRKFQEHVDDFSGGTSGSRLTFDVTFRTPHRVGRLLNATLPSAFGPMRGFNLGLPPGEGAPAPFLQVPYEPLVQGPENPEGAAWLLPLAPFLSAGAAPLSDTKLRAEARQIAAYLAAGGPSSVGANAWGDVCILAPRTKWLPIFRDELEAAGLNTALQMRRNRNGDNPAYAWLCGLLAVVCDPENTFEWVGVFREIFGVSDAVIAASVRGRAPLQWDEPGDYAAPIASAFGTLRPFIERADAEGDSLERFAGDLVTSCGLLAKARAADPEGGLEDELARLLARAAELGNAGGGPRAWLRDLLGGLDDVRSSGRPASDAVNLMTSHSAKGLEWPVVIPVGLWHAVSERPPYGLRFVSGPDGKRSLVYDNEGVSAGARESIERARQRELVRLLYVTLTRPKAALVIPWSSCPPEKNSFAEFWGLDAGTLGLVPGVGPPQAFPEKAAGNPTADGGSPIPADASAAPAPALPVRILPHELAAFPDAARAALHESSLDEPLPVRDGADPLAYGVWWHQAIESVPWTGDDAAVAAHGAASVARAADLGFGARAAEEWARLVGSAAWSRMREARWTRLAEVGIFAPLGPDGWMDGVIDLILHDPAAREVWILDWKTNRRAAGEDDTALLARLAAAYEPQLSAYGTCAPTFFPECSVHLWVYSTVAGDWTGVGARS